MNSDILPVSVKHAEDEHFIAPPLVPLTDDIRTATQGQSPYYGKKFKQASFEYHAYGRKWPDERLETFFADGLLQYYVAEIAGFDFRYNDCDLFNHSERDLANIYAEQMFNKVSKCFNITIPCEVQNKQHVKNDWIKTISLLFAKIKKIPLLLKKGGEFQRLKVKNEKLRKTLCDQFILDRDSLSKEIYDNDKKMDDLQFEIYNWINYFYHEVKFFIEKNHVKFFMKYDGCDISDFERNPVNSFEPSTPPFIQEKMVDKGEFNILKEDSKEKLKGKTQETTKEKSDELLQSEGAAGKDSKNQTDFFKFTQTSTYVHKNQKTRDDLDEIQFQEKCSW